MNLIEQHMTNSISMERWRAACISSEELNYVCGMMLAAAGLVQELDDVLFDVSTDNEYVEAFFTASEKLNLTAMPRRA